MFLIISIYTRPRLSANFFLWGPRQNVAIDLADVIVDLDLCVCALHTLGCAVDGESERVD
jgi:hypothetical protein